jgi:hypothetical protein
MGYATKPRGDVNVTEVMREVFVIVATKGIIEREVFVFLTRNVTTALVTDMELVAWFVEP